MKDREEEQRGGALVLDHSGSAGDPSSPDYTS